MSSSTEQAPSVQGLATADAPEDRPASGTARFLDSDLTRQVHFLTARARGRGIGHANLQLEHLDLKVRQFSVLSLAASGLNPSQRELGEFLSLDPSQIVALVDNLEKRGAVRRETDPRDRRSKIIVATDQGRELHAEALAILEASEDHTLSTLSPRERRQLRSLLLKIAF